jgi:hypothetical protein
MLFTHYRLRRGFCKRAPWVTGFTIHGRAYGGRYPATADPRLEQFWRSFPDARTVLELGSLEGGHTLALAGRPQVRRVVGLEGRAANVGRARYVQAKLGVRNVEFAHVNLETGDLRRFGPFDAVACLGLLYHLPRPWELLDRAAAVSPDLFLWTHYVADDRADAEAGGYRGAWVQEFGEADPLSGLSPQSFWPTQSELHRMLRASGFRRIEVIEGQPDHPHGPGLTLAASAR